MYITRYFVNTIIIQKGAFMVSICFKSLNKKTILNLECILDNINIKNIIYTQRKFTTYYNLIIHYRGTNVDLFYKKISDFFSYFISSEYEKKIIASHLRLDFFYFSPNEQKEIMKKICDKLNLEDINYNKLLILNRITHSYINNNCKIYIDGFINFRIHDYKEYLNNLLENEIHQYVVEKEYSQYTDLVRDYINEKINSNSSQINLIHLFYFDTDKNILDENYNIITTVSNKKYLSDISFSENDFILNSILSLVPKKIIIHTNYNDNNFINFLKSIFENKYIMCDNCDFCKIKTLNNSTIKKN